MKHKEGIEVKNLDVRKAVSGNGLKYKDVAKAMGITPEHLSRLLRFTLSQGNKLRIFEAIRKLTKGISE